MKGGAGVFYSAWYLTNGIMHIVSLAKVKKDFRVTFDSDNSNAFVVKNRATGKSIRFTQSKHGLYYYDTKASTRKKKKVTQDVATLLVNTVASNMEGFTRREVEEANRAHKVYHMVGNPSEADYKHMVCLNLLRNNPISSNSI